MTGQTKPALYALTPQEHATVLAALACYFDRVGDAFADQIYEETATKGGTLKAMNAHEVEALAKRLDGPGLNFSAVVPLFAESAADSPYVAAARAKQKDGEIEIDEPAVVSRGDDAGAYVMAWIWVSDSEAGVGDVTSDDEGEEEAEQ